MGIELNTNTVIIQAVQSIMTMGGKYTYGREIYFYIKGDHWEVGVSLPNHLRIGLGDSVSIELDTDKPYIHHVEHVKKYPPGHLKKKNKMKHNNKKHKWG
jgi:hypothetical protein